MLFRLVLSRAMLGLTVVAISAGSIKTVVAQQLQYSSVHRNGQRPLEQTLAGASPELREQMNSGRSAISLAVADFDGDGTPDLITGFSTGTGGALTMQRGSSLATAPTQTEWAAIQRGETVPAFAATANITPLPVRPDILRAIDLKGDGVADVIVAALGDNSVYVLLGDGKGGFSAPQAIAAEGSITALSTLHRPDGSNLLAAGVCQSVSKCSLRLFAIDGSQRISLTMPASASVIAAVSLNGNSRSSDLAIIAGGQVLLADGSALGAGTAFFETLPVSNAVALTSGYFVFDRRPYMQLAVLDSSATLHVLVRPGLDSRAVTQAESLAHRKLRPEQIPTPPSPAGMGWVEAETVTNVGPGGFSAPPLLLRARVSGSGGDDLLVLSGTQYITVRHAMDSDGTEMKTTPSVTVDSATNSIASAVPVRMSPDARQGVVVADGLLQPNISLPTVNQTFTVNTTTDASDGALAGRCTTVGPQCTLRDAILLANADSATNRSGSKIDTVNVPAGTYNLTYSNGTDIGGNTTHHIEITGPVNIVGTAGAATTIVDGQAADKIFSINSGINVAQNPFETFITGLTLQNAKDNTPGNDPYGGIMDWDADGGGYLTIASSVLKNSIAFVAPGGAIAAFNAAGSGVGALELDNSTVTANTTPEEGGGLYITTQVPLILNNVILTNNQAVTTVNSSDPAKLGQGGGIFSFDNTLATPSSITNGSTISGNTASDAGGGIYTNSAMTVTSSSITGNTSGSYGGGLYISVSGSEAVTGNYLTFTSNTATTDGGAIYATGGTAPLVMHYSRVHGNTNASHSGIGVGTGTINVTDNWWGCNGAGTGTNCDKVASGTITPYTTLVVSVNPTSPSGSASFTATASMAQDSNSTTYTGNQLNALSGVAATLVVTQPDSTVTNSGSGALNASDVITTTATPDTSQVNYGTGTAAATVDGFTVTTNFTLQESDMKVTSTHSGTFAAGSTGNTYTLTVSNIGNGASSGTVTVVDTLPAGFTATALSGTGWACTVATLTCTRSDALGATLSYNTITLTVTAGTTAGSSNNSVTVSGGSELYTGNDTGTDSTTVTAAGIAKFLVTGLGPFTAPGTAGSATVTAADTYNNTVTSFTGTVAISSNDTDATLPGNYSYVAGDNGVHVFSVTLNTAGTFSLTATATVGGYTGSETGITVQDAVWLLNSNVQMEHINSSGTAINQTSVTASSSTLGAIAFDNTGNVWALGNASNNLYEFSHTGTTISSGTSGGGINTPVSIAIDGLGNAWIANGNNTISEFTNSRTAVSPSTGYQSGTGGLSTPTGLIIDNAGSIWIANSGNNTVTKIIGAAAPVVTPTVTGTTNNTLGTRP